MGLICQQAVSGQGLVGTPPCLVIYRPALFISRASFTKYRLVGEKNRMELSYVKKTVLSEQYGILFCLFVFFVLFFYYHISSPLSFS